MKRIDYYEICKQKLKYLNYSKRTIETYLNYIDRFLKSTIEIPPSRLNAIDFQNYLNTFPFTSISQQNQVINSIRFLYKFGLDKKYDKVSFKRPRKDKKLPKIIDSDLLLESIHK